MQYGRRLHFVQVIVQRWGSRFQPLPLLALLNDLVGLGAISKGTARKDLPVVKHTLWEGLASSVGPQVSCEPEGLVDRQVSLHHEHGSAGSLCFLEHVSSPPVEHAVDATDCILWALNLNQVHWFHHSGFGSQQASVQNTPGRWNDLTAPTVNGISVEGHIIDVEPTVAHVLIAQAALLCSPLETSHHTVLDLVQILHSLGVGSEAPDLPGLCDVVVVLVSQVAAPGLEVIPGIHFTVLNVLGEAVGHGDSLHEQPVVLVGGL